jgi:NADP-dependent 3-hydroxy acid dehydrogenase YdfG
VRTAKDLWRVRRAKTAVVTGATSGIGAATARALAAGGLRVLLVGRNARKLAASARTLGRGHLGSLQADLASPEQIRALLATLAARVGALDVLVHCAGEYDWTAAGSLDVQAFERLFAVNVRAPYLLTQGLLAALARAKGQVIFLNSSVVRNPGQGVALYKATQHAVQGFTDSLRQDLNRHGIRLTSLYPGRTATPRMRRIYAHEGRPYRPGKLLRAEDVAQVVLALTRLPVRLELTDLQLRSVVPY